MICKTLCWLTWSPWYITDLRILKIDRLQAFLATPNLQTKTSFTFLASISVSNNLIIYVYLRYCWFKNSAVWLAKGIFNPKQCKMFKSTFTFLHLSQHAKDNANLRSCSWEIADLRILKSDLASLFLSRHTKNLSFFMSISICMPQIKLIHHYFLKIFSQFKNLAIWLTERTLAHYSTTRIFRDIWFVQAQT